MDGETRHRALECVDYRCSLFGSRCHRRPALFHRARATRELKRPVSRRALDLPAIPSAPSSPAAHPNPRARDSIARDSVRSARNQVGVARWRAKAPTATWRGQPLVSPRCLRTVLKKMTRFAPSQFGFRRTCFPSPLPPSNYSGSARSVAPKE